MGEVAVDFVARDQPHGGWALVLVEHGPWSDDQVDTKLRQLQDRLFTCTDAALDGVVATQFPESRGLPLVIRVDAYDIPVPALPDFFERFKIGIFALSDYAAAFAEQQFYPSIQFELKVDSDNAV